MILHAIAPRTKTTFDDKLATEVDALHDKVDTLLALTPRPPGAVPIVKSGGAALLLLLIGGLALSQTACGSTTKDTAKTVLTDVVDCTAADRLALETQFGPTLEQAFLRATGQDGKVDLPSLQQLTSSLKADGWCVAERTAAKLIAWVASKAGTASATAPLDTRDLAAKIAAIRVQKFGATQFNVGPPGPSL